MRLRRWLNWLYQALAAGDPVIGALGLGLFFYYCWNGGVYGGKGSGDGQFGFLFLPGLLFYHTLDLGVVGPEWAPVFGREVTGHVANPCPIGPTFLWWPTYLVGVGLKMVGRGLLYMPRGVLPGWAAGTLTSLFPARRLEAPTSFDHWMTGLSPFLLGLCGIALLYRLLRRHLPRPAARFAVVAGVLGTPIAWYLTVQPLYQHATAFFVVTLLVERWDAWRRPASGPASGPGAEDPPLRQDLLRWAALGAIGGFSMMVRVQEAIWLLLPGLDVLAGLWRARRDPRRALRPLLRGTVLLLCVVLCFAPQLLVWHYYYGQLRPAQAPGHMRWTSPALVETVFSMRAGLLPWVPLLYVALPGLYLLRRWLGGLAPRLALIFAIELWVNASAWDYHGSWAFGPRRFTDATVVFAAGLGGAFAATLSPAGTAGSRLRGLLRRGLLGLAVALVLFNLLLMELMRRYRIKSSCSGAFPATTWVRWAKGPAWLERAFARVGYPFVQPAAWIYGWIYRMPSTAFEGIVGNYLLERDWRIRGFILNPGFAFAEGLSYAVSGVPPPKHPQGLPAPPGALVPAQGDELRLIIPLSAREPVRVQLSGEFRGQEAKVEVRWNGERLQTRPTRDLVMVEVPERLAHARGRLNELRYTGLPPGTMLRRLDFQSFTEWWKPKPGPR